MIIAATTADRNVQAGQCLFLGKPFKHDLFVSYSHGDFDGSGRVATCKNMVAGLRPRSSRLS